MEGHSTTKLVAVSVIIREDRLAPDLEIRLIDFLSLDCATTDVAKRYDTLKSGRVMKYDRSIGYDGRQ